MIIAVASPVHGQAGNTTVALLLSLLLADTQGKRVCLTHLSERSSAFYTYLGLDRLTDQTCTPNQVAKLIRCGSITPGDFRNYCLRASENLDIFSNNTMSFDEEDMHLTQNFLFEHQPFDFLVVDIDVNLASDFAKQTLSRADLVVVSLTQSLNTYERYVEVMGEEYILKSLFLCNHYSPDIGPLPGFAKMLGVPAGHCVKLCHSPSLMKLSNEGKLSALLTYAKQRPLPVLADHMKALTLNVMGRFGLSAVWKRA